MEKYIFNDNTKLIFLKNNSILVENEKLKVKEKLNIDFFERLFKFVKNNRVLIVPSDCFSLEEIKFLKQKKIIKKLSATLEKYLNTKFEKYQIYLENIYPEASDVDYIEKNGLKKILFVGAGGICTAIIDHLISVGIKNFCIVDFDVVENTNLNRQFKYNEKDVGKLKTHKLKKNLEAQYSKLSISTYNKKIMSCDDLNNIVKEYKPDFIICAADTPIFYIQKYIVEVCRQNRVPCIFGGVGQAKGSMGPLLFNDKGFDNYLKQIEKVLISVEGLFPCKGSFGVTNSLVANYMAKDIINYIMNKKEKTTTLNKEIEIIFDRNEIYEKRRF